MNKQIKILVVDDEPKICHLIEELLKLNGYQVDVSFSGTDALKMIMECNYHVLIADLKMPGIDGLELIEKAKKQNPEIRTIMITGYATVDTAVQSFRHGVDDYIKKPFNIFELKEAVEKIINTRQVAKENEQIIINREGTNSGLGIHEKGLTE